MVFCSFPLLIGRDRRVRGTLCLEVITVLVESTESNLLDNRPGEIIRNRLENQRLEKCEKVT